MEEAAAASGRAPAIRFRVPDETVEATDAFHGTARWQVARELGDFVIAKADGTAAYQLAVVVDDRDAGVTQVVRGDDLLDSTPRQILLYRALGWEEQVPRYCHLPLVVGPDGRRLAKRHGDTRLSFYREKGVPVGRLLALLARWCGLKAKDEASLPWLLDHFRLEHVPRQPIVFRPEDDRWLRGG